MIELWIPVTIFAAFCQNLRSAVQKHLKGALSNTGATFSRFGYGLPVVFAYVLALRYGAGMAWPEPHATFVLYVLVGGAAQISATFLLVWLFSFRDFAVGTTYSKTEAVQAALFGLVILGDSLSLVGGTAIVVSLIGVMLLSSAKTGPQVAHAVVRLDGTDGLDRHPLRHALRDLGGRLPGGVALA